MVQRFHMTEDGPKRCNAKEGQCPLTQQDGSPAEHYSDKESSQKAFEENLEKRYHNHPLTKRQSAPKSTSMKEVTQHLENQLQRGLAGERLSNLEMGERAESVNAVVSTLVERGYETINRYAKTMPHGDVVWDKERREIHNQIIDTYMKKYENVPSNGEIIIAGGLGGAGKTTVLTQKAGIDMNNYAVVNPDDIKEDLAHLNALPKVKGLTPMEASPLSHEEASYLSKRLLNALSIQKKNIILDKTMSSFNSIEKNVLSLKSQGYTKINAIFVDIDPQTSHSRAVDRYKYGLVDYLHGKNKIGGRILPHGVIESQKSEDLHFKSKNAQTMVALERSGMFTEKPRVFDNNVNNREPVEIDYDDFSGNFANVVDYA